MGGIRNFLRERCGLAMLLVVLALAMKALVPAGYMVGAQDRILTVSICADASGTQLTQKVVVPHRDDGGTQHGKTVACPFSALAMAGTAGADPVLLALALAFILAAGFVPQAAPSLRSRAYLRPPLRGPPATP